MSIGASRERQRRIPRASIVAGIVVFLLLAGTGVASAVWTTTDSTLTASATAGRVAAELTGVDGLDKIYTADDLVDIAAVVVKNSGTVPAAFTFGIKATTGNNIANAIQAVGWSVTSAAQCTATVPAGGTTSASLTAGITLPSVNLVVNGTAVFCVRTSLTSSQVKGLPPGDSITAVGTTTASVGSWTSLVTASARQSVAADTVAPSAPGNLAANSVTADQITLQWSASTDAYGVTGYRVYRAGVAIATVTGLAHTDTNLNAGTPYIYTVRAFDAAGNESADSNSVTVTTTTPTPPTTSYRISNPNSGLCIVGENTGTTSGTRLVIDTCTTRRSQEWRFTPTSNGYFSVVPGNATSLAWTTIASDGLTTTQDYAKTALVTYSGATTQEWMPVSEGGSNVHFVNRLSGKCLDINGAGKTAGTQLQQYTCNNTAAQTFSRTAAN